MLNIMLCFCLHNERLDGYKQMYVYLLICSTRVQIETA